jgi:hypothetical protein
MAGLHGRLLSPGLWAWTLAAFSAAFALSLLAILLPLRYGEKRLSELHI